MPRKQRTTIEAEEIARKKREGKIIGKIELQALHYELLDPKELKPNSYNPNKQGDEEFELLRLSIRKDGFTLPIVANMDRTIIDGEHRWRAALAEGIRKVPVIVLDLDEHRMKLATIRHNRARGTHDADLEALIIRDLEVLMGRDFITENLAIDDDAIDTILNFESASDTWAGEEFGDSWEPVRNEDAVEVDENNKPVNSPIFQARQTVDSAVVLRSATGQANDASYKKVYLKDAEAGRIDLYTVTSVLLPEDALVIQKILEDTTLRGQTPAERLYYLCMEMEKSNE